MKSHSNIPAKGLRRRRFARRLFALTLTGVVAATSTGCTMVSGLNTQLLNSDCVDEFMINHRNSVMATKAWYREAKCHKKHCNQADLKAGFIAGYIDVANGGHGCVPATAPSEYWGWRYQSSDGRCSVDAWFEGFVLGVKAAEQDGIGSWSRVRTRGFTSHTRVVKAGEVSEGMFAVNEGEHIMPGSIVEQQMLGGESSDSINVESITRVLDPDGSASGRYSQPVQLPTIPGAMANVPVAQAPVASRPIEAPAFQQPSQKDIDSVIDDIFGKPDLTPAIQSEPEAGSDAIPFTFN